MHIGCIKVGFGAATNLEGSYYIRIKKLVADVVFQGVTAFKSVRNDNFVAFLSHCYFSVTVSARAVYAVISYLGAIVLSYLGAIVFKKNTRIVI